MPPSMKLKQDNPILLVQDVTKVFDGLRALDGVSFELQQGEILGLIGPNGSGKTTLINVITGLLPITSGKFFLNDIDLSDAKPYQIARAGISRTYQTIRLFKELTVMENIEVAAVSVGASRKEAKRQAEKLLQEFSLEAYGNHLAGALPYGHERRVEIARALAMKPLFLLLDEPAAGLNEEEVDELLNVLELLPDEKNLGMLIVEHDMHLIMRLCDRLHVLNYGKTIGEGTPEEVRRITVVVDAYLGSTARGDE
ncbi:MAG: ABC transporter ATP-binding protein [Anaerolineaceae bacterium]|nr:ABC transporter ATP-binding protein [Anaerolineaceae bacterium]